MPSSDLNIAPCLQESRSTRACGFRTITWRILSRQASRRSRIEIACRDPVNRPRPTFANGRLRELSTYTSRTRIRSQTMNFAFVTFNQTTATQTFTVVRDRMSNNNWKSLSLLPHARYFERGGTQNVENAVHCKRHALTFSFYYFYFFVPSILTSLMGYRSKCCYTRDTSHR